MLCEACPKMTIWWFKKSIGGQKLTHGLPGLWILADRPVYRDDRGSWSTPNCGHRMIKKTYLKTWDGIRGTLALSFFWRTQTKWFCQFWLNIKNAQSQLTTLCEHHQCWSCIGTFTRKSTFCRFSRKASPIAWWVSSSSRPLETIAKWRKGATPRGH